MIKAKSEVEQLEPYVAPLEGRRPMLRLDFNENTVGPSPKVVEAIRRLPPNAYATYPEYAGLNEAYAASINIPSRYVEAFNGVDAAIHSIFDVYGEKGSTFLTTAPTFGYYKPCALQNGMQQDEVLYPADLSFPIESMRERLTRTPRLCFICNPNNPTGTLLEPLTLLELVAPRPTPWLWWTSYMRISRRSRFCRPPLNWTILWCFSPCPSLRAWPRCAWALPLVSLKW